MIVRRSGYQGLVSLENYLPEGTSLRIYSLLSEEEVVVWIKKKRKTKLGDYRPPHGKFSHRISINDGMSKEAFLVTLLHEIAHMQVWIMHKNRVAPHGTEWKDRFRSILKPFVDKGVFKDEVRVALLNYLKNPSANSCSDEALYAALHLQDNQQILRDIPEGSVFKVAPNRNFRKGPLLRKRYKCLSLDNNKWYYVHGMTKIESYYEKETA